MRIARRSFPFPDGSAIAALHWNEVSSPDNDKVLAKGFPGAGIQSFIRGSGVNMQFMVKDSKKYAATGGWGFGDFPNGKPGDMKLMQICFVCHQPEITISFSPITHRKSMNNTTVKATYTSQTISVEHLRISSERSFAEVRQRLEDTLPTLDATIVEVLSSGDQKGATDYEVNGPKLWIFEQRDHGALLQIVGRKRNALQYEIGNPLTASKMTRHKLAAALYAPLRVVLFEDERGKGVFEYDKPSSFFGQFGDERVTEVGRYLDVELEAALRKAAD